MKIFAVIRNYGSPLPQDIMGAGEPDWYELPDSSVLRSGNPFFVPDFDSEFMLFPTVCYRIGRLGKSISRRFAHRYIDSATMAATVVACPLLRSLREHGLPWTRAVAFDRSCLLGNLQPIDAFIDCESIEIKCGDIPIDYRPDALIAPIDRLIEMISNDNTLKNGDLILAGLMPRGLQITPGMRLEAQTNYLNTKLIDINIK